MEYKSCVFAVLAAFAAGTAFGKASKGNCPSEAVALKGSQSVTLVNEWDPEYKEYWDYGAYYFQVTLSKGSSFTIWTSPNDDVTLDVFAANDEVWAGFMTEVLEDGTSVARISAGDWDEDDPGKAKFYVQLSGDIGLSVMLYSESGYKSFVPVGSEDNKYRLSFSESPNTQVMTFVDSEYWMTASLQKGRMYRIRTEGGTATAPVSFMIDGTSEEDGEVSGFTLWDDPQYADDLYNTAIVFSPDQSGTYVFIAGGVGESFKLHYQMLKARKISEHPVTALESVGYEATFTPGCAVKTWDYADTIIDEKLFSIKMAKGERRVFETVGASVPVTMVVYNSKGEELVRNTTLDGESHDVRAVLEATAAGVYYVGVCETDLGPYAEPTGSSLTLTAKLVVPAEGDPDEWDSSDDVVSGASGLVVIPGVSSSDPLEVGSTHGPHRLSATDWADTFVIAGRKDIIYRVGIEFADESETTKLPISLEVFTLVGTKETLVAATEVVPGNGLFTQFTATQNAPYYIRCQTADTPGLDYPAYNVRTVAYVEDSSAQLGILQVNTPGAPSATWSIGSETVKYPSGSSVLIGGRPTIKLSAVNGYKAEATTWTGDVKPGSEPTVVEIRYNDTFDPKDDVAAGATSLTLKNIDTPYATRTLWKGDVDNFAIAGADGYFYDLAIRGAEGDGVVFSITNDELGTLAENVASVSQLPLPKTKAKYIVTVRNSDEATTFGGYTLSGKFANVGAIKFAKNTLSVKENAASAVLTVNRTAKDGYVRVKYGTVAGTAQPGVDYVAQSGVLEWADGDNKAKTITVPLIPDLVAVYEGNKTFSVQLKAFDEDERSAGEYAATFPIGLDECVVTLTETAKTTDTVESAYAKKAPKVATVKTEQVGLESGTFFGLLSEDGSVLTNGLPSLASVTLTASAANPAKLSAKVALAGKNYTFAATGWDEGEEDGTVSKELLLAQKVNKIDEETGRSVSVMVTNTLTITVVSGATGTPDDWMRAGGTATLVMNVPDANNKGYQEEVVYRGSIYRNNAKIQDYLTAVTNFTGYYTVALAPEAVSAFDGIPAGNGYVTLTIDNKGTVKAAGMLADGATKPSLSVAACALVPDEASANGYSMRVPLYFAKSPVVFGGEMRLYADDSGTVVVDSCETLVWKNDNAALTYSGEEGYSIDLDPVGGFYDTIINLQTHYLNCAFQVETSGIDEFPEENLAAGYVFSTDVEPNGTPVALAGDVFSTAKKVLVKDGKLNDLAASVNPLNVQVKVARATGLVSGTFSLWSENEAGTAQKEITGFKHNGVLVLSRDALAPLSEEVAAAGFCYKAVKVTEKNETTGRTTSRNWTFSLPFNLLAVDQGEPDWWADDWGEQPAE